MDNTTQMKNSTLIDQFFGVFAYSKRALLLVWQTSPRFTLLLALFTLLAGILPTAIAYIGQLIVDAVVNASVDTKVTALDLHSQPQSLPLQFIKLLGLEALLVITLIACQRGISALQSLFRALLAHRVNRMILDKAQTLSLAQFEDSEFYDKLVRARREASTRPLALVNKTFGLMQNAIALAGFSVLLWQFSPWVIVILFIAALPGFFAETLFSGQAFTLFRWRSPEYRQQSYLETLLAREDSAKEVALFGLGSLLLERYSDIFRKLYREDRSLTLRRDSWGLVMDIIASLTFYGAYAWIIMATIVKAITLGQMTMYLIVFKQGQSAITASLQAISGMYEDNLYLSNLYDYLEQPGEEIIGGVEQGSNPGDGIRFEAVSFMYEGSNRPALDKVSFHIKPGDSLAIVGENGSGKTTLIKLLTRLYLPSSGRIVFEGTDITQWNGDALRQKIGVIFQDFIRYQFTVGENIGVGEVAHIDNHQRWQQAAEQGQAATFIEELSDNYHTQLGRWFKNGQELSGGQWQKMALSRAFMRKQAKVIILDEPTSAMDAQAEADIFSEFNQLMRDKMAILISHRFSTVRTAKKIMVIDKGKVIETGSHEQLMLKNGRYAHLFNLQAEAYR
ncbi:MAG: ATP-binding cassette subfamily B protein [Cellvibrionaceae bacterium]